MNFNKHALKPFAHNKKNQRKNEILKFEELMTGKCLKVIWESCNLQIIITIFFDKNPLGELLEEIIDFGIIIDEVICHFDLMVLYK